MPTTQKTIAFLPFSAQPFTAQTVAALRDQGVTQIFLLTTDPAAQIPGAQTLVTDALWGSRTLALLAQHAAGASHSLLILHDTPIDFGQFAVERLTTIADWTGAALVYSDYHDMKADARSPHPLTDYQPGSIRDDFNFGSVVLLNNTIVQNVASDIAAADYRYAGWYALRLACSRHAPVFRVAEYLYSKIEPDTRKTGDKQHDYVDPRNRAVQIEMERAATDHLKKINAYLEPNFQPVDLESHPFDTEASVIIPVRNRVKTVTDAVNSVLRQQTDFPFNCIVVDNHSTDGTTDALAAFAARDPRLIHLIPTRTDLGIGGCWNQAVHHPRCGRFAIQLDSDDLYKDETTIRRIVDLFRREKVAMVIGSYQMVNFQLQEIPPGIIDHKEWTPENGRNNALRINGLGAPRAFYTPLLRQLKIPNVSYGEDYAVAIALSRHHPIGRIYDPLYLCRRWEGNSDADLDIPKSNSYNAYKDKLRTIEILARQQLNARASQRSP